MSSSARRRRKLAVQPQKLAPMKAMTGAITAHSGGAAERKTRTASAAAAASATPSGAIISAYVMRRKLSHRIMGKMVP